jgi:hypothetical protein
VLLTRDASIRLFPLSLDYLTGALALYSGRRSSHPWSEARVEDLDEDLVVARVQMREQFPDRRRLLVALPKQSRRTVNFGQDNDSWRSPQPFTGIGKSVRNPNINGVDRWGTIQIGCEQRTEMSVLIRWAHRVVIEVIV